MTAKKTASKTSSAKTEKATGTYVFDKKLGKVVKVSEDVPGLNKNHVHSPDGSCCSRGKPCCGGGMCGMDE